jgi:hypothetical protein
VSVPFDANLSNQKREVKIGKIDADGNLIGELLPVLETRNR